MIKEIQNWRTRAPFPRAEKIANSTDGNDSEMETESMDIKASPDRSPRSNEVISHMSDSGTRYEASSPLSPPCATSPPPELQPRSTSSATITSANASYSNGYRNTSVFPHAASLESMSDGSYQCSACSVKFSSSRTRQVHQLYYCSQRQSSLAANSDTDSEDAVNNNGNSVRADTSPNPVGFEGSDSQESAKRMKKYLEPISVSSYDINSTSPRRSSLPTGIGSTNAASSRVFRCPYCRYSSDKKASLTRHIRLHGNPSSSSDQQNDLPLCTPPLARYCANCDIQFASFKNYQVHKQLYCSTRHVHKSMASSSPSQQVATTRRSSPEKPLTSNTQDTNSGHYNMMMNQPLYAAISTSPLILVPCSYVAGGGLSPAAGLIPAGNIIIPNGPTAASPDRETTSQGPNIIPTFTVVPGTNISSIPEEVTGEKSHASEASDRKATSRRNSSEKQEEIAETKRHSPDPKQLPTKEDAEKPLDLSFRKSSNHSIRKDDSKLKTHAPLNNYLPLTTPISSSSSSCPEETMSVPIPHFNMSHHHQSDSSSAVKGIPTKEVHSSTVADIVNLNSIKAAMPNSPQMVVKQGTSKCNECNIVFYKHENYLVHKSLYCASRLRSSGSDSPEASKVVDEDMTDSETLGSQDKSRTSISPIVTFPKTPEPSDAPADGSTRSPTNSSVVLQFYCMACGIKFTSLDNLSAHQTYYCPKRELVATQPVGILPTISRGEFRCNKCKNSYPTEETLRQHPCPVQRKCPYCDVYCPTLSATQRHLVTHTGVKSFRCSLCGYKGHTLRGMRTHIRIHLDKNNTTPEEAYIVCVDEGGSEVGATNKKLIRNSGDRSSSSLSDPTYNDSVAVSLASSGAQAIVPADISARKVIPDIVSDQVVSGDITHWCQICGYSSSYKGNVVRHVKLVHKELMATQSMASIVNSRPNTTLAECKHVEAPSVSEDRSRHDSSKALVNGSATKADTQQKIKPDEPVSIKSESLSPPPVAGSGRGLKRSLSVEVQSPSSSNSLVSSTSVTKIGQKYCKYCDISFNYLSNFIAHKKFYCTPSRCSEVTGEEPGPVTPVQ